MLLAAPQLASGLHLAYTRECLMPRRWRPCGFVRRGAASQPIATRTHQKRPFCRCFFGLSACYTPKAEKGMFPVQCRPIVGQFEIGGAKTAFLPQFGG